ncbi:sigma-70 family RNA polymerase sigma factor [Evansella sp. AB-rgal1]|uniref:sigma-70 family RNA polymerase sigma factor n=1 Tax=Evansella sp. AB-rgal1 TaxID=3242696 RepID=UPI00359E4C18
MKEIELVKLAQKGNDDAFYELMMIHKNQLYRMALTYLKREEDAIEAIQEVTFRAYKMIKKLRDPSFFQTWLIRILINYCNDEWKRKKRYTVVEQQDLEMRNGSNTLDHDTKLMLDQSMKGLKPDYRNVIILKFFEDLTVQQIADILQKPEGTIKSWLRRALQELKLDLQEADLYE